MKLLCCPSEMAAGARFSVAEAALGGEVLEFAAKTPDGKPTTARVLLYPACTHPPPHIYRECRSLRSALVPEAERDVMRASSHSLGSLLLDVLQKWPDVKRAYVGLGDSAVSDAGWECWMPLASSSPTTPVNRFGAMGTGCAGLSRSYRLDGGGGC
ncbi:MAG: glycerate kinase [Bdellovibrionota bacterium]